VDCFFLYAENDIVIAPAYTSRSLMYNVFSLVLSLSSRTPHGAYVVHGSV
jgi:hypothetical protein